MTGFARFEAQADNAKLQWELRSVNHRYLDVQLRLPESFRGVEAEFRQAIGTYLGRGKVDAALSIQRNAGDTKATHLNAGLAKELIGHADTIASEMKNPAAVTPLAVLRWPGVLEEEEPDAEELLPKARDALNGALTALCQSRAREGTKVQEMLESRCAQILTLVDRVRVRMPEVLRAIRQRLDDRVQALGVEPDPERMEQELAMVVQKLDISEELERMQAHVDEVRGTFTMKEPVGRRLDFLMQELNREANTLSSKSADTETTRIAVDLKVLIEQMREQVQNVE